jgi:DNA topoisomerase-3
MTIERNKEKLSASFKYMLSEGYLKVAANSYQKKKDDEKYSAAFIQKVGSLKKGNSIVFSAFDIKEGETTPPKRYNSGSLILTMENAGQFIEDEELRAQIKGAGIGTSATRDGIITKLVNNKYISLNKKTQIVTPTFLGEIIYDVVYYSINGLLRADLTASWEKGLNGVAEGTITTEEYTEKMTSFVTKYTNIVKNINNQNNMIYVFDKTRSYYKQPAKAKTAKKK